MQLLRRFGCYKVGYDAQAAGLELRVETGMPSAQLPCRVTAAECCCDEKLAERKKVYLVGRCSAAQSWISSIEFRQ